MEGDLKEVYFNEYCPKCKNYKKDENEKPCRFCMAEPCVADTHKPVNFEED